MMYLTLTLTLLGAPPALAAGYCRPLAELQKLVLSCDQNDYYLDAAIDCLTGLEKDSVKKADALGLKVFAKGGNQAVSLGEAGVNLSQAKVVLAALLLEAETRKIEVENYGRNVNFPEDFDNPVLVDKHPGKFLAGSDCYHRAGTVMESVLEEIEGHIRQIKSAQAAVTAAQRKLEKADVKSGGGAKAVSGATPGEGAATGKPAQNGSSDITGTEEEKARKGP